MDKTENTQLYISYTKLYNKYIDYNQLYIKNYT
jgi:hypothetical protein